ncbi:hypothetical protein [Lignipirellula cremea]|nr:hypothetical protein [Lignipirellula cremea]
MIRRRYQQQPALSGRAAYGSRRGVVEYEAVMTLGVMFPLAVALYLLAVRGFAALYDLIACSVGWPYL